jgi:hypothetical protein
MATTLHLPRILATSPTLAEVMRSCLLRAGLSRAVGCSVFILGNPKAWLGNAYHHALQYISQADLTEQSLDASFTSLWNDSVSTQYQRARLHPLDRRFGTPDTWPGYHLARAGARLRAFQLVSSSRLASAHPQGASLAPSTGMREQQLSSYGGKLVGRPDLICRPSVVDYKTGTILDREGEDSTEAVKAAYVRQLQTYGYLVKENLGWWPSRGILLPIAGPPVEVSLDPADCERVAVTAVQLLDLYNARLESNLDPLNLATPSASNCNWCPYKHICPAFWTTVDASWSGQLNGAAVQGTLSDAPRVIHDGAAAALTLNVESGSEPLRLVSIAPLTPSIHTGLSDFHQGDSIRISGLRTRPDGVLTPTQRTIVSKAEDNPTLETPP